LDHIPPPGFLSNAAGFVFPVLLIALIAAGFFRTGGSDLSFSMMIRWVLWKGSLAASGSLIALAHPLVIVVSFLTAPFTSFIPVPFISVGIISGLLQAAFYKPRVLDAQNIADDITGLKGIYRNRISRALLVFFLSGLGSSIANVISIPVIAGMLVK
jgi:pheromone shutdown protein TraB